MTFKRLLALLLALLLVVTLLPADSAGAAGIDTDDIWAQITALEDDALARRARADGEPTAADFAALSEDVERLVVNSGDFTPGSIIRHGSFFYWTSASGEVCGYSPALRAKMRASSVDTDADPEAFSGVETASYATKGGIPGSVDVAVFQPYYGLDSSFKTTYSDEGKAIAQELGGTSTTYKTSAGTIDKIAESLETCAVVIFDSHGDTDYANPSNSDDYVTKANTSYLCMQTNAGWTAEDQQLAQGPYGTYYHAYYAGGYGSMKYYCVDGTAIANHMQGPACNNLLWMAICLGMATDGMWMPVREKGVEAVYGYSQSVSFDGDYEYEEYFWDHMIDGFTVGESFAYMKTQAGADWDPAYPGSYSLAKARYNFIAFPNVVSSEDAYQGHRTVNPKNANDSSANQNNDPAYGACNIQTVLSGWTLEQHYTVTAVSGNEDWGTVSVVGGSIIASPAEGYYASGYEVLSGTATVVQNGNTFIVTAQSDCTVRIDFAPKTPATVTFITPDGVTCDAIATYLGDEIVLPAPAGAPTAAQNCKFLGWTKQPVEDTTEKPEYKPAGAGWTVDAEEAVFYALYTYVDDSNVEFTRLDSKPADWSGEYVITYNSEVVLDASGAFTGEQLGSSDAAIAFADTGMTLDGDRLLNVPNDCIYVFEPSATIEGTYTIRMKGSENYLSCKKGTPLFASGTVMPYNSNWQAIWVGDVAAIKNSAVTQKYLQYDTAEAAFCCGGVTTMNLTLYRASDGTAHYTTELAACEHDYVAVVTEPTCTEGGFTTYTCAKCGDSYVDDYVDALGHDYQPEVTAPTCTEGGFTTYTCARCGDSYVADETEALGHDWNEPVYTWAVDYSAVIAIRTCKNDESHVETEDGAITSEVTREPTINTAGEITYTATFTDPAFATQTVTAALPKLDDGLPCDGGESCPGSVFADMPAKGDWAHDAIDWAFVHGVTAGTSATTFGPNEGCTRAQVVTFLWRAAGSPEPAESKNPFRDVTENAYYYKAVLWAVENNVTAGTAADKFSPDDTCTRAQIVTFLWRYEGKPEPTVLECALTDVSPMDYYYKAVLWAAENDVTQGTGPSTFSPLLTCTRAQVVTFLYRIAK